MRLTTKLAVAMIALVAITICAVGWLNYRTVEQAIVPRALDRIESQAQLAAAELESYVAGPGSDIAGLRAGVAVNAMMRARRWGGTVEGVSEQTWRERIAARFTA